MKSGFNTNWIVITGGPSSGKTTLLTQLQTSGYHVEFEVARLYIDEQMRLGKKLNEIRRDEIAFQMEVLERKISLEKKLAREEQIFLERGIPDTLAYLRLHNYYLDKETLGKISNCNYRKIFILVMLPFEKDYARTEDEKSAKKIEKLLKQCYKELNFEVIEVPVDSVVNRIAFIKAKI